ncbi:MAG TPA: galactosyltransferase-related protein, partial [Stellaceae bacterium]|nr:galactosyltransferase-related protein [Stellaceae bacterium]
MTSVAIITTCKGRLGFLKQTLPAMVATGFPVTVVDYDCPEGTGDFVAANFPGVDVVRVKDKPLFNLAEARNIGAQQTASTALAFIDSDMLLSTRFAETAVNLDFETAFFTASPSGRGDLTGQCLVASQVFQKVGGYDSIMVGWGYEDADLYARLETRGLELRTLPPGLV